MSPMPAETPITPADRCVDAEGSGTFLSVHAALVEWLLAQTGAARWGLTRARFAQALERSIAHRFRGSAPAAAEAEAYLRSLHVEDLALACACSEGSEPAWEHFIREYRQDLYAGARALCGRAGEAHARDLADSLYGELYGLETRNAGAPSGEQGAGAPTARRRPLFDYFHGRSKLSTWLRAVLAQRHIDALRAGRRTESLDAEKNQDGDAALRNGKSCATADPDRARYVVLLQAAMLDAVAGLDPRDRLRLAYYYVHEKTLAEIGRILGEHEATSSRHLERARRELRRHVEQILRDEKHLDDAQMHLCWEYARDEWPFDLTAALDAPDTRAAAKRPVQEFKREPF